MDQPSLAWVIVDGVPRHVSEFADLSPRRRPRAHCPQCGRQLTLKLGSVRCHHAAHHPGQECAATRPETALHINTKLALASTLRAAAGPDSVLSILRRCAGAASDADTCYKTLKREWLHGWNEVVVEQRVSDARRPDIVLRQSGRAIGAIEIVVTHAVSHEMARALDELGVPWIEVRADERFSPDHASVRDDGIEVAHASDEYDWRCDPHRERHAADLLSLEARRFAEHEAARRASTLLAARVVDIYHAGGSRERFIYRVTELMTDGRPNAMRLGRGALEIVTVALSAGEESRRDAWPTIRTTFSADVSHLVRDERSFADSPMRWARGEAAENIVEEALADRVGRDPTPLATRFPRRWFFAREQQRWFLPAEMRDVRWDRPPGDLFAAHPAWSAAQGSVRERNAPEGSWSTPVFASRPIAALFRAHATAITPSDDGTMSIVELQAANAASRLAIVVIERTTSDASVATIASALTADGVESIWLSHPSDWVSALSQLTWAPAGRDWRGHVLVVIDEVGIFRADQFARGLLKRDRRLSTESVRRHMAARVERLRGGE